MIPCVCAIGPLCIGSLLQGCPSGLHCCFTATLLQCSILDLTGAHDQDASRDNWDRVSSLGERPYNYSCIRLNLEGPGCDSALDFLHDRHLEDIITFAESLGYSAKNSVWWGYSEGAAMASGHLNYLLQHNVSGHVPKAMVLESNGGSYCYAFRPDQQAQLQSTQYWSGCTSWSNNNCCPRGLTEQWFFQHPEQYKNHPSVLLVSGSQDVTADPNGLVYYHDAMVNNSGRSATATWSGSQHGISPVAFGVAASYIKDALLNTTAPELVLKADGSDSIVRSVAFADETAIRRLKTDAGVKTSRQRSALEGRWFANRSFETGLPLVKLGGLSITLAAADVASVLRNWSGVVEPDTLRGPAVAPVKSRLWHPNVFLGVRFDCGAPRPFAPPHVPLDQSRRTPETGRDSLFFVLCSTQPSGALESLTRAWCRTGRV